MMKTKHDMHECNSECRI